MYIISRNINEIDYYLYIIRPINYDALKEKLRQKFKAKKNSEYDRIVKRINLILFEEGANLTEIYENLFNVEYNTFFEFLEEEECLDSDKVNVIRNELTDIDNLWVVKVSDYEGYNFAVLFNCVIWEENHFIDTLNKMIKECEHEN